MQIVKHVKLGECVKIESVTGLRQWLRDGAKDQTGIDNVNQAMYVPIAVYKAFIESHKKENAMTDNQCEHQDEQDLLYQNQ